ncbi:MAG TPA: TonB-dependent receptor, partial [Pyrinomonadaceae bacterium]
MKNHFRKFSLSILFVCLSLLFFNTNTFTQDLDDVTISGTITDPNNAPVVSATVTATLIETGTERTITTDEAGRYRIVELQPGIYKVRASATGFGAKERVDLQTISGQNLQLNFNLAPATVQAEQTVTVTDEDAPVVDTTRTVVGGTVTEREIEELPNSNRNALDLVFTLGGVTEEPLSTRDIAEDASATGVNQPNSLVEGGIFSLSGGAAYSNNITIDGLDNNDDRGASDRFQPSIDAIAEVQVITNQFSAEYGRASGGRINIRTRAGTNRFRGRAFLFFRDDNLNANTYNNNRRGIPRLEFTEYNPGFTLSGPIPFGYFKDKTYFFSSYEYNNLSDTTLIDTVVPVAQNPNFALPAPTDLNRQRRDIAVANDPANAFIAPYIVSLNTPSKNHIFTQRIDHNFTDKHNITFNYQFGRLSNFRQYQGSTRVLEDAIQGRTRNNDAFYITDNYVFSQNLVNQFRFQFSNYKPGFAAENPNDPVVLIRIRDTASSLENRSGTLTAGNSTANFASTRRERRYQFQDTLNYVFGSHTVKGGADVQLIESENLALGDATGTYNFDSVADFIANRPIRFRQNFGTNSVQNNTYFGIFLQDEWRVNSKVTLSSGLRYERESIVDDNNNLGPRIGLAYSPFNDNKTVIRFGAGIFYNRALLRTLDDYALGRQQQSFDSRNLAGPSLDAQCFTDTTATVVNSPRCAFLRQLSTTFPTVPTYDQLNQLGGFATTGTFTRRLDEDLKIPESYQFNVGFERDLGNAIAFEANFTYNKTVRLWRETNVNAFILPSGFNTYTDFLLAINDGPTRFELGPSTSTNDTRVVGGVTFVNLNSTNRSTSATSPIGRSAAALGARLNRGVNNSLGQIEQVGSMGSSVYEGLILELRRRFRRIGYGFGASFRAVYTLSRLRDDGIVNTSSAQIPGNFEEEFSLSVQDRRHRFAFSGSFETPNLLGKLRFSPILRIASGNPFNLSSGGVDRNLDDVSNDRPNFNGNLEDIRFRNPGDPFPEALLNSLSLAPIGSPGDLPRNAGRGPA